MDIRCYSDLLALEGTPEYGLCILYPCVFGEKLFSSYVLIGDWQVAMKKALDYVVHRKGKGNNAKDVLILSLRFGLLDGITRTQRTTAEIVGLSPQRIRQREQKALYWLKVYNITTKSLSACIELLPED